MIGGEKGKQRREEKIGEERRGEERRGEERRGEERRGEERRAEGSVSAGQSSTDRCRRFHYRTAVPGEAQTAPAVRRERCRTMALQVAGTVRPTVHTAQTRCRPPIPDITDLTGQHMYVCVPILTPAEPDRVGFLRLGGEIVDISMVQCLLGKNTQEE